MKRIRFVLVGEGAPLLAVARYLATAAGADISGIVSSTLLPGKLKDIQHGRLVTVGAFMQGPGPAGDWLLSVNSEALLPKAVLDRFSERALNLHNGPLPAYAGRHVTQWGIRNGETEFASTIHFMAAGVDAGDIVAERRYPIRPQDTGLSIFRTSFREGRNLMIEVLDRILAGDPLQRRRQTEFARHNYRHRDALDPRVPWTESARRVVDFLRAGDYRPLTSPSYTASIEMPNGETVLVYRATEQSCVKGAPGEVVAISQLGPIVACGAGGVLISDATFAGKVMDQSMWRNLLGLMKLAVLPGR